MSEQSRRRDRGETNRTDRRGATSEATSRRGFLRGVGAGGAALTLGIAASGRVAAHDRTVPWLHREGNELKDPEGNTVVLRGVNVVDPARATPEWGHRYVDEYVDMATDAEDGWHARVIRMPMQPQDIGGHGPGAVDPVAFDEDTLEAYLETYVDDAVAHCRERGVYVMLDYHRHYPEGPDWNDPAVDEEIRIFWELVAPRYADQSHVIYEVFNEPTTPYYGDDAIPGQEDQYDVTDPEAEETWLEWRETAQPWVDLIREHAEHNVIAIGSPRWSQWTYWAPEHEFEGENLAYTGHVYTQENIRPLSTYFGAPSEEVPVFLSEFGFLPVQGAPYLEGSREVHGEEFEAFFDEYEAVHPQAWCFDHTWKPAMLDHDYEIKNEWGEWVQDFLAARSDQNLPQAPSDAPPGEPSDGNGGGDPGEDEPPAVGGYEPQPAGGDGYYRDLDGSGTTGSNDVVVFFEHLEDPAVADHPEFYDFNGSGGVGFDDVVALFQQI